MKIVIDDKKLEELLFAGYVKTLADIRSAGKVVDETELKLALHDFAVEYSGKEIEISDYRLQKFINLLAKGEAS